MARIGYMITGFLCLLVVAGCASEFERLMKQARTHQEDGYLTKASELYEKACAIEPGNAECESSLAGIKDVLAGGQQRPTADSYGTDVAKKPSAEQPKPTFSQKPKTDFDTRRVGEGETLSGIAMDYYDTFKTTVYSLPDGNYITEELVRERKLIKEARKAGNVLALLETLNKTRASDLQSGQKLKMPVIYGLRGVPFPGIVEPPQPDAKLAAAPAPASTEPETSGDDAGEKKPGIGDPVDSDTQGGNGSASPLRKTGSHISDKVKHGITIYHGGDFSGAKSVLNNALADANFNSRRVIAIYLALIELAHGNESGATDFLNRLKTSDPAFKPAEIYQIYPEFSEDSTPAMERLFQRVWP